MQLFYIVNVAINGFWFCFSCEFLFVVLITTVPSDIITDVIGIWLAMPARQTVCVHPTINEMEGLLSTVYTSYNTKFEQC